MRVGVSSTETDPRGAARAGARQSRDGRRRPRRRGHHRRAVRRPGRRRAAVHGRRARPRHQGDDAAPDGRARLRGPRAAGRRDRRRGARRRAGRRSSSPTARATRPPPTTPVATMRGVLGRRAPGLRHLLRQPDARPGARLRHLQAELRPPRHQPAGAGPQHRPGRDHRHNHGFAVDAAARRRPRHPVRPRSRSATSASTTTSSRGCGASTCRRSPCSTTRRPRPARTTPPTCSTASPS